MPGKWVGGKGSLACPTKGQLLEAQVFDDGGNPQQTLFLEVKRLFGTGATGRSILCDYITASDAYYRYWVTTGDGVSSTVDGLYHLCKGHPTSCTGGGKDELVIHLGKWRIWTEAELTSGKADHLEEPAQDQLLKFFKSAGGKPRRSEPGELPWEDPPLNLRKQQDKEKDARGKRGEEDKEKQQKRARMSRLREELEALKADLQESESEGRGRPRTKKTEGKRKKPARREETSPRKAFRGAELGARNLRDREENAEPSSSYGTEDEDESGDGRGDRRERDAVKAIRKKAANAGDKDKKKKDKERCKAHRGKDRQGEKRGTRRAKDRGPFGVAPSEEWVNKKDDKESESEASKSSSDDSSFQKAPSSRSHHLKLVRYAKRYPGRLAARLLKRMESATGFGGAETKPSQTGKPLQPVAHMYYLAIVTPHLRDKWTQRTQREVKVATTLLDLMVSGQGPEAADILAQRIKALEKSVTDNNQWRKARYLELVEADEAALIDPGEEDMMTREADREEKTRRGVTWSEQDPWKKGRGKGSYAPDPRRKGQEGTKGKGKKGNPGDRGAAQKDEVVA